MNQNHATGFRITRATRCEQFLFSLSLNPLKHENVSTEIFEQAIKRAEKKLGLNDQPRAIVFHEIRLTSAAICRILSRVQPDLD